MDETAKSLRKKLTGAGISEAAINAAWPAWWSEAAASSPSAQAELRFTLARRLGLAPKPLLGERVEFVWKENARYKHLADLENDQQGALASFGVAVSQHLAAAAGRAYDLSGVTAPRLREMLLRNSQFITLANLLAFSWGAGVPVAHLKVFPLPAKSMHAMAVRNGGRQAILLGRDASYPAPVAFTLAHEIGHVVLGHVGERGALVDLEDPALGDDGDPDEIAADEFALELLTGSPHPEIEWNIDDFNGAELADAVLRAGPDRRIEPGTLALCVGYKSGRWKSAMSALSRIYPQKKPVWMEVNRLADKELKWDSLSQEQEEYLRLVLGLDV
ncbi:hypothetical protein ABB55_14300 [Prosthecomicrobium hirschii]|uniref:Uncharacterized protein n=1 Tax=Prosthecodimorpha hirschii TaxID=665126 RepID=A0A0P6W292_9HYPH|nr:ImmA/IrrE family metallo-endopeptidase [Prosthecomicrobium hirschii]KPL53239.1 hypothetical protein ABB55_14300 [Prosthecomicrobium hirschii]